jgi:hypothetical protein
VSFLSNQNLQSMKIFLVVLVLLFTFTIQDITTPTVIAGEYPSNSIASFDNGKVLVRWRNLILQGKKAVEFAVVSKISGWCAIGINPNDGGMGALDLYMGYMNGANLVVEDKYVNGLATPSLDSQLGGQDSIIAKNGGVANGEFTVNFFLNFLTKKVQISTFGGHWRQHGQSSHQWKQCFGCSLPQ